MNPNGFVLLMVTYGLALGAVTHFATWIMCKGLHWITESIEEGKQL